MVELPRVGYGVNAYDLIAIKTEVWNSGFFDPVKLPYRAHPEGGLLVVDSLELTEEVTFSCACHYIFHQALNTWLMDAAKYEEGEEFMSAVEIPADGDEYSRGYFYDYSNTPLPELQSDEFWESDFLIYPRNKFFPDEYDDDL
ncbi:hypothetical protein [Nostoc sp.]|uniref:hypothetical protein n=1 Tax=Nostoc sp. TaxID=1180 RepID=UPI002FF9EB2B